jgi:zinc/manganese transport system substrate-binding protein
MLKRVLFFILISCHSLFLEAAPLKVVVSFSILGDVVSAIGKEHVVVTSIVGPNGDAHVYQPKPSDAKNIANADILFINGLGFEGWIERLIETTGFKKQVVVVTKGIKPRTLGGENSPIIDPHVWHNPHLVKIWVHHIVKGLSKIDPLRKEIYEANGKAYIEELRKLDQWIKAKLQAIPKERKRIVTAHDAFGYFSERYNVEIISPVGLSTDAEPTVQTVNRIIRFIKKHHISTIFLENISNAKMIEQIAEETGAKIGGILYSDSLSTSMEPGDTYLHLMYHNMAYIENAMSAE